MDCYRTCDIRGRYPDEINEDLFFEFGRNLALKFLRGRDILIGSDLRVSSMSLRQALIAGLVGAGAQVYDAGQLPTPVLCFGKRKLGVYAAAVVTASHNPPEDNGLKLLLGRFPATASQLRALRPDKSTGCRSIASGRVKGVDIATPYIEFVVRSWRHLLQGSDASGTPGTFVFDPGNGTWSLLVREIVSRLGISATFINVEPDGSFPGRSPDCAAPGSLLGLSAEVQRQSAAAGLAWDGDGDRLAVCDDAGRHLFTDHLVLLLLPALLSGTHGEKILVDVKMSGKVRAAIERCGGIPIEERSAHSYLETRMINEGCLFGCEYSGHLFYRSLGGGDDGMFAALHVVGFLRCHERPLSTLLSTIPTLFVTPDLRVSCQGIDFAEVRQRLQSAFPDGRVSRFDGLRIQTPGAWLLVRPSVSEYKLTFRFEGENLHELDSIIERALQSLSPYASLLEAKIRKWRGRG